MPSHKRPQNTAQPSDEQNTNDSSKQHNQNVQDQPQQHQSDSDGRDASSGNNEEYINVPLRHIRKEVQCPICLGIIRKTRTVMECLHRFCKECIEKSMRLWKNECPVCLTHCASRRSLRDDPNYDALISALYPDIDKYEEKELDLHQEERDRNKQIQASTARATNAAYATRSQAYRNSRGRRNQRANEQHGCDDDDTNDHDYNRKDSCSFDEKVTEVKPRRSKRLEGSQFSQTSLAAGSADGGDKNDFKVNTDSVGASE